MSPFHKSFKLSLVYKSHGLRQVKCKCCERKSANFFLSNLFSFFTGSLENLKQDIRTTSLLMILVI